MNATKEMDGRAPRNHGRTFAVLLTIILNIMMGPIPSAFRRMIVNGFECGQSGIVAWRRHAASLIGS